MKHPEFCIRRFSKTSTTTRDTNHDSQMRQKINVNGNELFADMPAIFGGNGSAPTPYDYLDVALITCKAITIRMLAAKQKNPVTRREYHIK